MDQLGYIGLNNMSNPTYDPDETLHIYALNVTKDNFNLTIKATTCSENTKFDT